MKNKNSKKQGTFSIRELKGFRHRSNGKIEAHKMINGKRYWAHFQRESDAYYWKKNFHPLLNSNPERPITYLNNLESIREPEAVNGMNKTICFREVWASYWNNHLLTRELHTQHNNKKAAEAFYGPLLELKMCQINRGTISKTIALKKKEVLTCPNKKALRFSFNNELKKLSTLFNWYKKNYDYTFQNPVCDIHKSEGFIRKVPFKKKKLTVTQLLQFFKALESGYNGLFWRDFAETQLYIAGRVQEAGGLLWRNVHFDRNEIEICEVAVYLGKEFVQMKTGTKNGEVRVVKMNGRLKEILLRRLAEQEKDCPFVFHLKGKPMSKQVIDRHYNGAFKEAGLSLFKGTHVLRHTMANLIREHLSLDHAKAAGGWRSSRVVELIYTDTPTKLSHESLTLIENVLNESENDSKIVAEMNCGVANCG